jgi:hypothetical protein
MGLLALVLQAKTLEIPPQKNSAPTKFTPLKDIQSEGLGKVFLHLLDTLNPAVTSISP